MMAVAAVSCSDYLKVDKYLKDRMTVEDVFTNQDRAEAWLAESFSYLTTLVQDVSSKYGEQHNYADDIYYGDAEDYSPNRGYPLLKRGEYETVDPVTSTGTSFWSLCYKGIRQATIYIQNGDMLVEDSDYVTPEMVKDYIAQARFVRAYYYWQLLRKYGPVPIIGDDVIDYELSYDEIARPRNTFDECVEFIADEMALAAKDLPLRREALAIARPTRGAALATRAKALLYGASPWNNPHPGDDWTFPDLVDNTGKMLMGQTYDETKWARAAAAAQDVLNLNVYQLYVAPVRPVDNSLAYPATIVPPPDGDFSEHDWPEGWRDIDPFESYRSLFDGDVNARENPELIFTRGQNAGDQNIEAMVVHQIPKSGGGYNVHGMTMKQCDAYYMDDGSDCPGKDKEIGRGDGTERLAGFVETDEDVQKYKPLQKGVSLQFANREPRFYASVAYSGTVWPFLNFTGSQESSRYTQVFYYRGLPDGYESGKLWLRSGIGFLKYVNPRDVRDNLVRKTDPAIRYADILLIYAEALNELTTSYSIPSWDGAGTCTVSRDVTEMKRGIRPVRCRAGLPDFPAAEYQDADLLRARIKRERQIELVGEGQRWYDLRRWEDADVEENLPVYGYNTLMTGTQRDIFYLPVEIDHFETLFTKRMYFWPIRHSELKRNKFLTQNPGWTTYD